MSKQRLIQLLYQRLALFRPSKALFRRRQHALRPYHDLSEATSTRMRSAKLLAMNSN